MANKNKRPFIQNISSSVGQKMLNDQMDWMWGQLLGLLPEKALSDSLKGVINSKVSATDFTAALAEKAGFGDLDGRGDTLPADPALNDLFLYYGVVPNEWLRWKNVGGRPTERRYPVSVDGASVSFPDLSDNRKLNVTVKTVAAQAGSGTPSPSNVRAISGKAAVVVSVGDDDYTLTPDATLYGLTGYEDEIGNDGHVIHKTALKVIAGTEAVAFNFQQTNTIAVVITGITTGYGTGGAPVNMLCSHFPPGTSNSDTSDTEHVRASTGAADAFVLYVNKSRISGWSDAWTNTQKADAVKAWLVGKNIQVLYKLATPTTATVAPVEINGVDGPNVVTSDGVSLDLAYSGSGWTNIGNTFELATLLSDINASTVANDDFRGLLETVTKRADGLLLSGLGAFLALLLGPGQITFLESGEEVLVISGQSTNLTTVVIKYDVDRPNNKLTIGGCSFIPTANGYIRK